MLRIGEFAVLSKISIYMLRHYNEIGLLMPVFIDELTGYRYYNENQLPRANRIQALKNMGIGLGAIKEILEEYGDSQSLMTYMEQQQKQKQQELDKLQGQLMLLNGVIENLKTKEDKWYCDITIKKLPSRKVISYKGEIKEYQEEGLMWQELWKYGEKYKVQYAVPRYEAAIYYEEACAEDKMEIEVQREIVGDDKKLLGGPIKTVEERLVASLVFSGEYGQLYQINQALSNWIHRNGYIKTGPLLNIYHRSPGDEENQMNLVTEVCCPIIKK